MDKIYKEVSQAEFDTAKQVKDIAGSDSTRTALEKLKKAHTNWANVTWPALYSALGTKAVSYQKLGVTPDQVIEYLNPMTVLQVQESSPVIEEPPVIEKKPVYYTTYVYTPDGNLYAKRTWENGKRGYSYFKTDGISVDDILKDSWYRKNFRWTDEDFFQHLNEITNTNTGYYNIKSGDIRKPGKVYLELKEFGGKLNYLNYVDRTI